MNLSDSIKNLKNKIEDINNKVTNLIKLSSLANAKAKDNETKVENLINATDNNLKNINENIKKINIINDELYSVEDTFLKLTNTDYVGKTTNFIDVYPSKFMIFGGVKTAYTGDQFTGSAEDWDSSSQKAFVKIKISNENETKDLVYKMPSTLKNIGNIAFDRLDLVNMKLHQKCDMLKLTGSESWERDTTVTHSKKNTITFKVSIDGKGALKPSNNDKEAVAVSNNNDFIVYSCNFLNEHDMQCFCFTQGGLLKIQIKRSSLATQDVDGFKAWLSTANLAIFFEKESESVTNITGEKIKLCPNATIEMTNAVKPSKVEIKYKGSVLKAFEELKTNKYLDINKQDKTDNALNTTDKTVVGAINEINDSLLDNVTFSADYKNIIINRKGGTNPYKIPIASIIHNAKITEFNDVDDSNIGDGKTLIYDASTKKHKYISSAGTDELVKMDNKTNAKYLSELIDKSTVVNDNGVLKVKQLDGQNVTIAEINHLKGLTMNVMDLVNAFANGGVKVLNTPVATHADLSTLDRSTFLDGISYIVYVLADETHSGTKTTYLCDKTSSTFFGNADSQRNFTTDPINLANEVTGKLGTANIDVDALWKLLTINDTYKTLTTKDEVFGTHGAKALYDELVVSIGKKANSTNLTKHTGDTNIHVTTGDKAKWNEVDNKVDKTSVLTAISSTPNNDKLLSEKAISDTFVKKTDLTTHTSDKNIHITSEERTLWNDGARKIAFVGSNELNSNGWYKVAEQTCSGYGDTNITFMVTSTFKIYHSGILQLQIRSDVDRIECDCFKWLSRIGFPISNFIIVLNGMTWTLYAYQPSIVHGRIAFEILSMSSIEGKDMTWTLNFKDNNTKETTAPVATVTSSDGATDVPVTNIAPADTTTFINFKGNSNCNYCVKNGICYVSLWGVKIASTGGTIKPGVILPKSANNRAGALMTGTGDATEHAFAFIIDTGELCFDVKDANIPLYGSFSYPVA